MNEVNQEGKKRRWKKIRNISILVIVLCLILFCAVRFYYPFGEGAKTGQLNFIVYKGVIFKTYEGRLIQNGFQTNSDGGIQSNEFNFSVADKEVAEELMKAGGQMVELHYKEYFGALPWRGYSKFIVNKIINITPLPVSSDDVFPLVIPQ